MSPAPLHSRFAEPRLVEALADTPVVLIHGPRQCGKTTLARMAGDPRGYAYFNFDDAVALAAAQADPVGFVSDLPERAILDEVQRAPGIFTALKTVVDRHRTPGRFILTGSAKGVRAVLSTEDRLPETAWTLRTTRAADYRGMRRDQPQVGPQDPGAVNRLTRTRMPCKSSAVSGSASRRSNLGRSSAL